MSTTLSSPLAVGPMRTRLLKLQRGFLAGRFNNPHVNAVMASPPTITSGSQAVSYQTYTIESGGTLTPTNPFDVGGGVAYIGGAAQAVFPCVKGGTTGGNIDNTGRIANGWRVRFVSDAPTVSIGLVGYSSYRFIVDSGNGPQFVSATATAAPSAGGMQFINLAFGSALPAGRTISIEGNSSAGLAQVSTAATYSVWKPVQGSRIKIGVIGDSIDAGTGATFQNDGFVWCLADFFGCNDAWMIGLGGTGYISTGSYWAYNSHITDWTQYTDWDLLIFSGGNNDYGQTASAITTAAQTVIGATRTALPNIPIVVLGPHSSSNANSATTEAAILAAVTNLASPTIGFVPLVTFTEGGHEFFGTGNASSPTGDGNADRYTSGDGTHPTTVGHLYAGSNRALRVAQAIDAMLT